MKTRVLGKDLTVSAVGLGCMGFSHAFGAPTERDEAIRQIETAADMGYTFFDTAECYMSLNTDGSIGYNEELVGAALRSRRDRVVIATKFGVRLENGTTGAPIPDARPEVIRRSVEGSLKRLGTEYIDLYYQHRIDPGVPAEEVAGVMADLIREGKIRCWGISEATEDYIRRAHAVCPVTAVENRYSMMARRHESLFPVLEELGIGFVAFSPMANGFLTGKYDQNSKFEAGTDYRSRMPQFSREGVEQNRELLAAISKIAAEERDARADLPRVDDLQKALYRADPRLAQDCPYAGERGCVGNHIDRSRGRRDRPHAGDRSDVRGVRRNKAKRIRDTKNPALDQ